MMTPTPDDVATLLRELVQQANDAYVKAREEVARIRARADSDVDEVWHRHSIAVAPINAERDRIRNDLATIANHETPKPIIVKNEP